MSELNPYAPPRSEVGGVSARAKKTRKSSPASGGISEAIERLNEHLADRANVEMDRQQAGGRIRGVTVAFVAIVVIVAIGLGVMAWSMSESGDENIYFSVGLVVVFLAGLVIALIVMDLNMSPRDQSFLPDRTARDFFKAISLGRLGYAWSALCPTAREQSVDAPLLGDLPRGEGTFTLRSKNDFKQYLRTFARPGMGQMRTMQVKRVSLVCHSGNVAVVEVDAFFQAWPQWAQVVSVIAVVFARAVGLIVLLVLFFGLRKSQAVTFRKTLIRGSNKCWYMYSADLLERAPSEA